MIFSADRNRSSLHSTASRSPAALSDSRTPVSCSAASTTDSSAFLPQSRLGAQAFSVVCPGHLESHAQAYPRLRLALRFPDVPEGAARAHRRISPSSTPNPAAGGQPGGVAFDGNGPGHCNCDFAHNYPYAYRPPDRPRVPDQSPRLCFASVRASRTSRRTDNGFEFVLHRIAIYLHMRRPMEPRLYPANGVPYKITWPNFDPGQVPLPGTVASPSATDRPARRPPARILQWSFGLQREIRKDLVVEADLCR